MASCSFTLSLEAHSQAEAGEELSFRGIKVLEIVSKVLVLAGLISNLTRRAAASTD